MTEQLIYGLHAVNALLKSPFRDTKRLFISQDRRDDSRLQALLQAAEKKSLPVEFLSRDKMKQRFAEINHQGVVAQALPLPDFNEHDLLSLVQSTKIDPLVLILDGITDPHNLGACLRTADAVGVDFVIIPKDRNANITPVVSKVASGAAELIPLVRVTNLVRSMEIIKQEGVWIYGAAAEADDKNIYQLDLKSPLALVLGSEGDGLRRLTREHCDALFSLPMRGSVESLNVSVAAAVSLYEVLRQRLF